MASAVTDTNVVVSAIVSPRSVPAIALESLRKHFKILATFETLAELHEVVIREKFSKVPLADREALFTEYMEAVEIIRPTILVKACRHPKDGKFLSLAVSGGANLILTGDNDLLVLHPFRNIDILKPKQYLDREQ
jgi:putative PIN family toxin of toxin-antitoxin system